MNYLDEFGLSDDDIKAIDEGIEEANKFFAKVSAYSKVLTTLLANINTKVSQLLNSRH
jgi:hypothetical protein